MLFCVRIRKKERKIRHDFFLPQKDVYKRQPYETAGAMDTWYLIRAMEKFYSTFIHPAENGWRIDSPEK